MPVKVEATPMLPDLSPVGSKAIEARLDAACMSSDSGLLALHEVDQRLAIASRLAGCIRDPRDPSRVVHGLDEIIRTRMLMIAAGYEDGNDVDALRRDPMFKLAMGRLPDDGDLCSQPTISRLENLLDAPALLRMGRAMVEHYCRSFPKCHVVSCSISTTRSTLCMVASSCGCLMRITMNAASSQSWCSMATAA